jgi:hypothetical protein
LSGSASNFRLTPTIVNTAGTDIENATIISVRINTNLGVMKDTNGRYYYFGAHAGNAQYGTPDVIPKNWTGSGVAFPHYISSLPSDVTSVALGASLLYATRSGGGLYVW